MKRILLLFLCLTLVGCQDKNKEESTNESTSTVQSENVKDTEAPVITYEKKLSTNVGTKLDLLKGVSVSDNSNEELEVTVEGDYDFDKAGTYTLYYIAKDSSGNEAKEEFTLTVKAQQKQETTAKTETSKTETSKTETTKTTTSSSSKTSKGYTIEVKNGITYIDGILIANKTYGLPSNYAPGMNSDVVSAANKMFAGAKAAGYSLKLQSGFRSYSTQSNLYNNYVKNRGKDAADTFSARPGHSEHQTGLAFDVCESSGKYQDACINSNFDNTAEAKWLSNNAYKYGFILRYPSGKTDETGYKYESWHFRYVGVELATKLYNNGDWITLEDYLGITSEYQD